MDNLIATILPVFSFQALFLIVLGTAFGIIAGAIPGLGTVLAITIALPFTFNMEQIPSFALLLSIYCSSMYGGSLSAILINTPGTPQAAATCLDGFPMMRAGKADYAIGWATVSSTFGGIFSTLALFVAAPQLARIALRFGPIETFALICMALTSVAGVSQGSILKGLVAAVVGLFLATIGADPVTGTMRFDFGIVYMTGGIGLIPVLVGLFALSEVLIRAGEQSSVSGAISAAGFKVAPLHEWMLRKGTLIKSALIGTFIGVLPGTGATVASFISYAEAKRSGRFRDKLGTGEPEGIVASETANNAVTGGALIPTLALGIPGDPATAILMTALIIQGIQPGVRLFVDNPGLMNAVFVTLILSNLVMLAGAAVSARFVTRILKMPEPMLMSAVVVMSFIGAYGVNGQMFDVLVLLGAGIVGFVLRLTKFPIAPIVIGMVLGPIFEQSLRQGLIISDNNFLAFFSIKSPIALLLFGITLVIVFWSYRRSRAA